MDKMREEFSKHCQLWRYSEEVDENDFFVNATTQRAWDVWVTAWQASRAALVVELKQSSRVGDSDYGRGLVDGSAIYKIYVEGQLDNAGVKWTE